MAVKATLRVPAESPAFVPAPEMQIPTSAAPIEILRGISQSTPVGRGVLDAPSNAPWRKRGVRDIAQPQATGIANAPVRAAIAKCSKARRVAPVTGLVQVWKPAPVEFEKDRG